MSRRVNESLEWGEYFYLDETSHTGLRWAIEIRSGKNYNKVMRHIGDSAGGLSGNIKKGFRLRFRGKVYTVSRIIVEMTLTRKLTPDEVVDHINGDNRDNRIENLRVVSTEVNNRNLKKPFDNTSGVVGVNRQSNHRGVYSWVATCYNIAGGRTRKSFSESVYGKDGAFELACKARAKMMDDLNSQGAGYTERHGV